MAGNEIIGLTDATNFPPEVGEGIFGWGTAADEGSFGRKSYRRQPGTPNEGVFYAPYARTWYEAREPDTEWVLEQRPGLPLYPGTASRGLVLVGPSMGVFDQQIAGMPVKYLAIGAVLGLLAGYAFLGK